MEIDRSFNHRFVQADNFEVPQCCEGDAGFVDGQQFLSGDGGVEELAQNLD